MLPFSMAFLTWERGGKGGERGVCRSARAPAAAASRQPQDRASTLLDVSTERARAAPRLPRARHPPHPLVSPVPYFELLRFLLLLRARALFDQLLGGEAQVKNLVEQARVAATEAGRAGAHGQVRVGVEGRGVGAARGRSRRARCGGMAGAVDRPHSAAAMKLAARPRASPSHRLQRAAPRRGLAVRPRAADTARGAIDDGIALLESGDAQAALAEFTRALTLPGTGLKRYRDKPPSVSEGEAQAALYNCACAHAALGDVASGLAALSDAVAAGDGLERATLAADPDLESLRADPGFAAVFARLPAERKKGLFGGLFG